MHSNSSSSLDVYCHNQKPFYLRGEGDEVCKNGPRFADLGELQHSPGNGFQFHYDDLSTSSVYNDLKEINVSVVLSDFHFGGLDSGFGSAKTDVDLGGQFMSLNAPNTTVVGAVPLAYGHFENWADSGVDTSTHTDNKCQYNGIHHERSVDSLDHCQGAIGDHKGLRRLAQNREAARKSRMRKKAYVQQLESSRQKLTQLEKELKRARPQGMFVSSGISGNKSLCAGGNGASAFDMDYARWLDEHHLLINELRSSVSTQAGNTELRLLVESVVSHFDELFHLKSMGTKSDVFHMLSGMWKTPAERCFMWLGGFRCSEILKILGSQIEPLTEQQLIGIRNLQQSLQQAEDALSQGMEALQQSLVDTLSTNPRNSGNVANYMGQMVVAMSKLATLENFIPQADLLRRQTLQQLQRILTSRQAAHALLAISDYSSRLRALSSLWLAS